MIEAILVEKEARHLIPQLDKDKRFKRYDKEINNTVYYFIRNNDFTQDIYDKYYEADLNSINAGNMLNDYYGYELHTNRIIYNDIEVDTGQIVVRIADLFENNKDVAEEFMNAEKPSEVVRKYEQQIIEELVDETKIYTAYAQLAYKKLFDDMNGALPKIDKFFISKHYYGFSLYTEEIVNSDGHTVYYGIHGRPITEPPKWSHIEAKEFEVYTEIYFPPKPRPPVKELTIEIINGSGETRPRDRKLVIDGQEWKHIYKQPHPRAEVIPFKLNFS